MTQMTPLQPISDAPYMTLANSKATANSTLRASRSTNFLNIVFAQLHAAMQRATRLATFRAFIRHVFGMSAEEQMVWVYARANITAMANMLSDWNWAIPRHPSETMNKFLSPSARYLHLSIAMLHGSAHPQQASTIGLWNGPRFKLAPKLWVVHGFVSHSLALLWRLMVRAGIALPTRFRPAFSTKNCRLGEA